jgi:copper(I)-binding protein
MRPAIVVFCLSLALAACGAADRQEAQEPQSGFIRLPSEGMEMSAAYLTLELDRTDRLVGAAVEGIARTELHTVREVEGVTQMRPIEAIDVRPGEPLVLEPGGHHLMLIGITEPLAEGEERKVTLRFENGEDEVLALPVRGQRGPSQHEGH